MSGSKVRLTPVRSRGERRRGRKERRGVREEKELMQGDDEKVRRHLFFFLQHLVFSRSKNIIKALHKSSTYERPLPRVPICTCNVLCIYCSLGHCCFSYLLLSRCQADGKPCTMLPTSCALFQLLKGTGPDGVCVCGCVCLQVYTLAPGSSRTGTIPTGSSMQSLSPSLLLLLFIKSICVGLYRRHVCVFIVKNTVCRMEVCNGGGGSWLYKLLKKKTWFLFCICPPLLLGLLLFCYFPFFFKPAAKKFGWHSGKWSGGYFLQLSHDNCKETVWSLNGSSSKLWH